MMRIGRIKTVALVATLTFVGLSTSGCIVIHDGEWEGGSWNQRAKFERTVELEHALAAGGTLVVSTASGSIETAGEATDQVRVVATIWTRAGSEEEAQALAEEIEIGFQEAGERLEVKAEVPPLRRRSVSISYKIVQPRQTSIDCSSASGSVQAVDLDGNVKAHSASGSAKAERIKGNVRLNSASGSVRGQDLSGGDIDLSTASGSASLTNASEVGACRLHSSSGSVRARQIQAGSIHADSGSGSVTAEEVNCTRLTATSGSGNVSVAFAPGTPKEVAVETGTGSGSINVTLPSGFAGRVDLSASSGSIDVDLPVTMKGSIGRRHVTGSIGDGSGSLTAHTGSGSIHVR
ncbi:MAG: DUF4097 domain-containing protein [Planctomycetes bacterium]|nr:DUF4097 domain-containing protein [Planctomycetota bacterium]